jgi:hypothetical protein
MDLSVQSSERVQVTELYKIQVGEIEIVELGIMASKEGFSSWLLRSVYLHALGYWFFGC